MALGFPPEVVKEETAEEATGGTRDHHPTLGAS